MIVVVSLLRSYSFPPGNNFVPEGLLICGIHRSHSVLQCPIEKKNKSPDK